MTANTAEAEDLTQEAFLQLFRKIATFRGESAFSTWLHRMAVNVVLMQLRKKSLPVVPLDETLENEEEAPEERTGCARSDAFGLDRPGYGCKGRWMRCRRDIEGFLCCTMWKDTSTTRLPPWWDVPSATANLSYTRRA